MSLSTTDAVSEIFARAVQDHLQKALRTSADWDRFNAIKRETDARLMVEQAAYAREFTDRMAEAKQILLREETGVRLDQPLPPGAEAHSSLRDLDRKAGERVRQDYDRRIRASKRDETDAFQDLTVEIRARDAPSQQLSLSFNRTRSGPSQT